MAEVVDVVGKIEVLKVMVVDEFVAGDCFGCVGMEDKEILTGRGSCRTAGDVVCLTTVLCCGCGTQLSKGVVVDFGTTG